MFRSYKYKRFGAIFFDLLLISVLTMLLTNNTISNPYYNDYNSSVEEYNNIVKEMPSTTNNSEELNEYVNKLSPAIYNINKTRLFYNIWFVVLSILYFAIFQFSTGGQTLGKKLYRLKVVNENNKKASITSLLLRTMFIGEFYLFDGIVIISILNIIGILLINNNAIYMLYYIIVNLLGIAYEIFMIVYYIKNKKNDTIHDKIAKTKVIEVK